MTEIYKVLDIKNFQNNDIRRTSKMYYTDRWNNKYITR